MAYLLRSGAIEVSVAGQPDEFLASMEVDGGVTDDWPFVVRMAETRMLQTYAIADGKAFKIERHCGEPTFKVEGKRYDTSGQPHICKHRRKK